MSKKWIIVICCVLAAAFLLGAIGTIDLAYEPEMKPEDRMIGMIVTTSPVWGQPVIKSGNIDFGPNEGVPAEKKEKTSSRRSIPAEYDFVFPGVEGVRLFNVDMTTEYGKQVDTRVADEEFSRIGLDINDKENTVNGKKVIEREYGINGTLYYVLQDEEVMFFSAPIYQKADGGIYLGESSLDAMMFRKDQMEYSRSSSFSKSASYSHTENGEKIVEGRSIKAKIQLVREPVKITLCQYNAARELIQADEYLPGEMPRDITPLRDTAMMIQRTKRTMNQKNIPARRSAGLILPSIPCSTKATDIA